MSHCPICVADVVIWYVYDISVIYTCQLSIPCIGPVDVVDVMLNRILAQSAALAVFSEHICDPKEGHSNRNGGKAKKDEESSRV